MINQHVSSVLISHRSVYVIALLFLLMSGCAVEELSWNEEAGYRWAELNVRGGEAGFEQIAPNQSGVTFANHLRGEQVAENRHRMHGSGVALGDVDGDGWTDIYFARLAGDNVLYKNKGGWQFEDVTLETGVSAPDRYSTGAVFADIDGDNDLDLLVNALGGPNVAYLNDGAGHFEEATETLGLSSYGGSTSMALADVEGDGDLDLYVANYKHKALRDSLPPDQIAWERVVQENEDGYHINPAFEDHYELRIHGTKLLRLESAEADHLLINDGTGRFSSAQLSNMRVLDAEGVPVDITQMKDWALSVRFQDLNGDLAPDLYVCNDFESPDYIWLNNGQGTFKAISPMSFRKTSNATMSVAVSDINRDGDVDIFLADMLSMSHSRRKTQKATQVPLPAVIGAVDDRPQVMQNTFFLNRGDQTFAEVANLQGLQASEWTWASAFMDVDLDGYEDLVVTNGHAFDVQNFDAQVREQQQIRNVRDFDMYRRLILDFPPLHLKNVAFKNEGGVKFTSQPDGWGLGVDNDVSHGMAMADLDNDGDLDVVVNRLNQEAGLFKNTGAASRVAVRLQGAGKNTQGIGAKIKLLKGAVPFQEKEVISGGLYLSGSDPVYSFAAGTTSKDMVLEVTWRNGETSRVEEVQANRIYEIAQASGEAIAPSTTRQVVQEQTDEASTFAEVEIDYQHTEAVFDDFARQPLLPRRFSQAGPAVVWADIDGDRTIDLLVGSGEGGQLGYFENQKGSLVRQRNRLLDQPADLDQTGIVVIPAGRGRRVLVAMSNYEAQAGVPSFIRVYDVQGDRWEIVQDLDFGGAGIGPLSAADVDGDGDIDIFGGGSIQPGRYPAAASSRVFVNDGAGNFSLDEQMSAPFTDLGMVNGSVFGDVDLDGDQDLVLALDWGALRYFENDGAGSFSDQSQRMGLMELTGMWHGVDLGDFNGDGRLDIVATNWGLNGQYKQSDKPQRLYWADYDRNGITDVLEAYHEPSLQGYVPQAGLNLLMYALPYLRRRIQSYSAFSTMTMPDILGTDNDIFLEAADLEQKVLLNTGSAFEPEPLPILAQVSPGFGVSVGDYDLDGQEDVFIAQNFFAERLDVARSDAGRGLWLKGGGDGRFTIAEGTDTGIKVYGEQRGAALGDYNGDGRIDVAISQNGNKLKLYQNTSKKEGIRVVLSGPATNPWAIGSQIRLIYTDGTKGPARNISVGSGYLSQNSVQQVLGIAAGKTIAQIEVRWPDGREEITTWNDEAVKSINESLGVIIRYSL